MVKECLNHPVPKKHPDSAKHCAYCGNLLPDAVKPGNEKFKHNSYVKPIIVVAAIGIVFLGYQLFFTDGFGRQYIFNNNPSSETSAVDVVGYDKNEQGEEALCPDVEFYNNGTIPHIDIIDVQKHSDGVTIRYSWNRAPEGYYELHGEVWDNSVGGQEKMIKSVKFEDVGEVFIPVNDWNRITHVHLSAVGINQDWSASGGFIPIQ